MDDKEIREIFAAKMPFDLDEKIFQTTDPEGNIIGAPHSYNDKIARVESYSGINEELLGPDTTKP